MPKGTKPRKLTVDFSKVEDRQGSIRVAEGDYLFKIKDYEVKSKKDDETSKYINWKFEFLEGPDPKAKGKPIYYITSLKPEALFNLKNMLGDLGFKVPKKVIDVPLEKCIGKKIAGTVADDEYDNKIKSKVQNVFSASQFEALGEDEDEDETDEDEATEAATEDDEDEDSDELELVDDDDI